MTAEDVLLLYQLLTTHAIATWIIGGWGIDALLGEQTRLHKDLDVLLVVDDVSRMLALLRQEGFHSAYQWEENRFVRDQHAEEVPTAFVWQDEAGREIDAHVLWLDEQGNGIPAWVADDGLLYPPDDLGQQGVIAGMRVRCISPEMQLKCHTGYVLPESQARDLERIQARFGIC